MPGGKPTSSCAIASPIAVMAEVNWCEALGTVLANDEVINGVSERGGYPVVRKRLRQWYLRITEYADRLLEGLERVTYSDAMKEMQSNWIGKSYGANIFFELTSGDHLEVYTTRPDTIFGVDFMVLAPEHELIGSYYSPGKTRRAAVDEYVTYVGSRSERERMAEKRITGCFTGAFALNPFDNRRIPVWISEYVLAGYGTGAIMGVPCGDERDFRFARHFDIPITNIIGDAYMGENANPTKDAILSNSGFLDGKVMRDAIEVVITHLEKNGKIGRRKVNYKMRDAAFSRQRYWGEPFPIRWIDGIAVPLPVTELPLELPHIEKYGPGPEGEGPLANIPSWTAQHLETNTMPGYAGSSWYFLRYMDPHNDKEFCSRAASDYWNQVDLYIGGTEHAVGHLLYSRMWTKALYDLEFIGFDEPYKKLVNQGMIQGSSRFVYRIRNTNEFVSYGLRAAYDTGPLHVDVNIVDGVELDLDAFRAWSQEFAQATFILEDGKYICGIEVEKMSKRLYNTVNPNTLVNKYGADTYRMYEMFLGPVEQSKPWDTKGIEGVFRFMRKLWRLFDEGVADSAPTDAEFRVLHRAIKKIEEDTERFSFNTGVSAFMVCVNDLHDLKCHKRAILEPLLFLLAPYAPHVCEELWHDLGHTDSIQDAPYPKLELKYLVESSKVYPIAINGRTRTELDIALDASQADVEALVRNNEVVQKWLEGKPFRKVVYVSGKMINVVT